MFEEEQRDLRERCVALALRASRRLGASATAEQLTREADVLFQYILNGRPETPSE